MSDSWPVMFWTISLKRLIVTAMWTGAFMKHTQNYKLVGSLPSNRLESKKPCEFVLLWIFILKSLVQGSQDIYPIYHCLYVRLVVVSSFLCSKDSDCIRWPDLGE
jgi:hypothetical protein